MLTEFDWIVLSVLGVFMLVSFLRGAVSEIVALMRWVVAWVAARILADWVAPHLAVGISSPPLAHLVAFLLVFVTVWLVMYLVRTLLTSLVNALGLGSLNRLFGAAIGGVKGAMVVTLGVLVAAFSDFPQLPAWRNSVSAPFFEAAAVMTVPYLPPFLGRQIHYPQPQRLPETPVAPVLPDASEVTL